MTKAEQTPQSRDDIGRKPMKVLSTSLGVALAANLLAAPAAVQADGTDTAAKEPKLVEWSSEAVKAFYDPKLDWNLVLPDEKKQETGDSQSPQQASGAAAGTGGGGAGNQTVVVHSGGGFGGGFGWDDLLLYHLLVGRGGSYSTSSWSQSHAVVDMQTRQAYRPKSYTSDTFQNKPVVNSTVRPPQTTASSGSFSSPSASKSTSSSGTFSSPASSATKSTSSSPGSIGGKSSGFSSSGGSSSSGS
jgi:hypothetical protein